MNLSPEKKKELEKKLDIKLPDKDIKNEKGFNKFLSQTYDDIELKSLKEIKKELGIKDIDIAEMFGYANAHSYRTSKAREKIDKGLELFYHLIMKSYDKR